MPSELRVAAMVALVENAKIERIGKTQLQKMVYFLQCGGVPLDYKYEIYHYGPYSFELSDEMNSLDSLGLLTIESDPNGFGFHITTGKFADRAKLDPRHEPALVRVLQDFAPNSPAQLEVKATIHFVNNVMKKRGESAEPIILKRVKALKPQFSDKFIKTCYAELSKTGWV